MNSTPNGVSKKIHLEGLNEIRGLAALGVLFGHLGIGPVSLAPDMVTIFFTLSGFLISFLLLKEKEKTTTINIKKFYFRRLLRIWPLYFVYIGIIILLFGWSDNLWFYVFFAGNLAQFFHLIIPNLGHFWSLAVEEQFYVFWPWLSKYVKSFLYAMVGVMVVYWLLKVGAYIVYGGDSDVYKLVYMSKFQSMAIGGVGAFAWYKQHKIIEWLSKPYVEIVMFLYLVLLVLGKHTTLSIIDPEILSVVVMVVILQQVKGTVFLKLRSKLLSFIGMISFGIYVYHPLVIHELEKITFLKSNFSLLVVTVFLVTGLVSYLSYRFLEKPFLSFKERFMVVKSGRKS